MTGRHTSVPEVTDIHRRYPRQLSPCEVTCRRARLRRILRSACKQTARLRLSRNHRHRRFLRTPRFLGILRTLTPPPSRTTTSDFIASVPSAPHNLAAALHLGPASSLAAGRLTRAEPWGASRCRVARLQGLSPPMRPEHHFAVSGSAILLSFHGLSSPPRPESRDSHRFDLSFPRLPSVSRHHR